MLIAALMFGQVGSGFLHNKHDAHEEIVDLDSKLPVLVKHGEHCKVCSVDLFAPFINSTFSVGFPEEAQHSFESAAVNSLTDTTLILNSGRAPPIVA